MIFGLMFDSDIQEEKNIRSCLSRLTACYTDEKLELKVFHGIKAVVEEIYKKNILDVAVIDVTAQGALDAAKLLRKHFARTEILVIADFSVSPMQYMHPAIRASALLLRPESTEWETAIRDFYKQLPIICEKQDEQTDVLWIKNHDGRIRIPFDQIDYLEAREKKVFIRTGQTEFGVTETMEKLSEQLPENFVKCHRSFVVNTDHITQIKLSENLLYLGKELFVPVSRTYKERFKGQINE